MKDQRFARPYSDPRWWWGGNYTPSCFHCAHFRGAWEGKLRCIAFPDGIPSELYKKGVVHDTPYEGDNGIRFEKADA